MPPVRVSKAEWEGAGGERMLRLHYDLPGGEPGTHSHLIPEAALAERMAMYGLATPAEAVTAMVLEVLGRDSSDPNRAPSLAERKATAVRTPVQGVTAALAAAGIALDVPPAELLTELEARHLARFGRAELARMRGVAAASLPDPARWHPDDGPLLTKRLPTVAQ